MNYSNLSSQLSTVPEIMLGTIGSSAWKKEAAMTCRK